MLQVASPLASHTTQVTTSLNGNSFRQLIWNLSYTFTRSTDQSSFSGGSALGGFASPTTGGDPNLLYATTSDLERRHGINGSLTWLARPWLDVTSVLRLQSGQPYTPRVGGDIKEPKRLHYVDPVYPTIARQAKVQGIVIIEATIGKDGSVKDAHVLRPVPLLDQAALDAVKQWKYTPTLLGGVPVEVLLVVTVNFTLK